MSMRIGGLASGMDIDQIVGDLMKAERMPLDKLYQKKQVYEWQRDDYREMNKLLAELDDFIFNGVYKQSTFTPKIITSSNESAVMAKNISSTIDVNTTIRVDQLAEAAYMNSASDIRSDTSFDPSGKLTDERTKLNTDFTSNTFTIQAVKADGTLGNVVEFTIDPDADSLNAVIDRINKSDAGVTAFYDDTTGRLSMIAKNTGDVSGQAEIVVTGDFLTGSLDLASDNIVAGANGKEGKNAVFNINGIDTERYSNTFQINGFEYTLKQVTDDGDGISQANELVNITSETDVDSIYNSIVDFVVKYNEIIGKINSELSEERYRDYLPLTEEQKKELSDKDIELWEEKAKSGILKNDLLLSSGLSDMRMDLSNSVDGISSDYNQLSELGITTSGNYLEKGKLIIDEIKLKAAINDDPNAVYELFNTEVKDAKGDLVYDQSGIAVRLRETTANTISFIEQKAGNTYQTYTQYSLGTTIHSVENDIIRFEDRLISIEDRYWSQFTAMELAIQRANEQAAYLAQQFAQ